MIIVFPLLRKKGYHEPFITYSCLGSLDQKWNEFEQPHEGCPAVAKGVPVRDTEPHSKTGDDHDASQDLPPHARRRTNWQSMQICCCASEVPCISVPKRKFRFQTLFFLRAECTLREAVAKQNDRNIRRRQPRLHKW